MKNNGTKTECVEASRKELTNALTREESILLFIYREETLPATITHLREMQSQLTPGEKKLKALSDSLLQKLEGMTGDRYKAVDPLA